MHPAARRESPPCAPAATAGVNLATGQLVQQAYLGELRDVRILLAGGAQIRALTSSGTSYAPGEDLFVEMPIDGCYLLHS